MIPALIVLAGAWVLFVLWPRAGELSAHRRDNVKPISKAKGWRGRA